MEMIFLKDRGKKVTLNLPNSLSGFESEPGNLFLV